MQNQTQEPVDVLRQQLNGQRPVDDDVVYSAGVLADKLARLKALSPIFEGVCFSPDIEAVMDSNLAMTAHSIL